MYSAGSKYFGYFHKKTKNSKLDLPPAVLIFYNESKREIVSIVIVLIKRGDDGISCNTKFDFLEHLQVKTHSSFSDLPVRDIQAFHLS